MKDLCDIVPLLPLPNSQHYLHLSFSCSVGRALGSGWCFCACSAWPSRAAGSYAVDACWLQAMLVPVMFCQLVNLIGPHQWISGEREKKNAPHAWDGPIIEDLHLSVWGTPEDRGGGFIRTSHIRSDSKSCCASELFPLIIRAPGCVRPCRLQSLLPGTQTPLVFLSMLVCASVK